MAELYTTLGESTLSGGINDSVTTLTVASAASFPSAGVFRIRINDEIMRVDSVSGADFTVVRGQEGTTATSHSNNDVVVEVVTAAALDAVRRDMQLNDAWANLPSGANVKEGDLFLATDSWYKTRRKTSTWEYFGGLWRMKEPTTSDLATWVNQDSVTESTANGGITLIGDRGSGGAGLKLKVMTMPARPYTLTAALLFQPNDVDQRAGIAVRDSGGGRIVTYTISRSAGNTKGAPTITYWTDPDTVSSTPFNNATSHFNAQNLVWLRIFDNDTNFTFEASGDGVNFWEATVLGRTAWLSTPDQLGIAFDNTTTPAYRATPQWVHWEIT